MLTPMEKFAEAGLFGLGAQRRGVGVPTGRTDHDRHLQFQIARKVGEERLGRGEVDGDIGGPPLLTPVVDPTRHLDPLLCGQGVDQASHLAVADDQDVHPKNSSCSRCMACGRSACRMITVMLRLAAACEIIRSGTSSSTPMTRAAVSGSVRSRSPTAHTSAISDSTPTSLNTDSAWTMASRLRRSSTVIETLTSEVVTTSTAVRNLSNTSNTWRRRP